MLLLPRLTYKLTLHAEDVAMDVSASVAWPASRDFEYFPSFSPALAERSTISTTLALVVSI